MNPWVTRLAAATAATGLLASAAGAFDGALKGAFESEDGQVIAFREDGVLALVSAAGEETLGSFTTEDDTVTLLVPDDADVCAGQSGVYAFAETASGIAFTLLADACETRAADLTVGEWTRRTGLDTAS